MHCPNCGSKTDVEGEVCARCGERSVGSARVPTETHRAGRRRTILGVLSLLGGSLIMLILMSKGLPPFLALLWTCWIFLGGVIVLAEGSSELFSARRLIKAQAYADSQHRGGTPADGSDQSSERRGPMGSKVPGAEEGQPRAKRLAAPRQVRISDD